MKHVFTVLSSNYMLHGEPCQMTYASFENETDALEFYMSLAEEDMYEMYLGYVHNHYQWFMARLTRKTTQVTHADVVREIWSHMKTNDLYLVRLDLHVEKTVLL